MEQPGGGLVPVRDARVTDDGFAGHITSPLKYFLKYYVNSSINMDNEVPALTEHYVWWGPDGCHIHLYVL